MESGVDLHTQRDGVPLTLPFVSGKYSGYRCRHWFIRSVYKETDNLNNFHLVCKIDKTFVYEDISFYSFRK